MAYIAVYCALLKGYCLINFKLHVCHYTRFGSLKELPQAIGSDFR